MKMRMATNIDGYPLNLKHDQTRFIRIPSLNIPEMRPLGTFYLILSNVYHGNHDHYKNFDFSFGYSFEVL